jgi:hypothetical protein
LKLTLRKKPEAIIFVANFRARKKLLYKGKNRKKARTEQCFLAYLSRFQFILQNRGRYFGMFKPFIQT